MLLRAHHWPRVPLLEPETQLPFVVQKSAELRRVTIHLTVLGHVDVVDVALDALLLALGEQHGFNLSSCPWTRRNIHRADVVVDLARALRLILHDYRQAVIDHIDDDIPF